MKLNRFEVVSGKCIKEISGQSRIGYSMSDTTDFYDMDEYGYVGAVVSRDSNRNEIYSYDTVYVVENVVNVISEDGAPALKVYLKGAMTSNWSTSYVTAQNAKIVKISLEANNMNDPKSSIFTELKADDLAAGDVVQLMLNGENEINYVYQWADASKLIDNPEFKSFYTSANTPNGEIGIIYGTFKGADIKKSLFNVESTQDLHCIGINLKNVFIVNCRNGEPSFVESTSLAGIADGDRVIVYCMKQYPISIVVLKDN